MSPIVLARAAGCAVHVLLPMLGVESTLNGETRLLACIACAVLLLQANPAHAQRTTYDPTSGNGYHTTRRPDGSTNLLGCNRNTGATWFEHYEPDGTISGVDKDGREFVADDSVVVRARRPGPKVTFSGNPACEVAGKAEGGLNLNILTRSTDEQAEALGRALSAQVVGATSVPAVPEPDSASDAAKREFERASGLSFGQFGCLSPRLTPTACQATESKPATHRE